MLDPLCALHIELQPDRLFIPVGLHVVLALIICPTWLLDIQSNLRCPAIYINDC